MKFVFALLLSLTAILHAQSSSSMPTSSFENVFVSYLDKAEKNGKFCKANAIGLDLLILDGFYVIGRHVGGDVFFSNKIDTLSTHVYTSDIARELPVWTRAYGVSRASPDSVIAILKEMREKNADKIDRDEINISFPYQDESIYKYKKFFGKLKAAGFSKIKLLAKVEEFSDKVYKNLQLKKYSKKQIESWESSKHSCNDRWLHVTDSTLSYIPSHKPIRIVDYDERPLSTNKDEGRDFAHVKNVVDDNIRKLPHLQKKYQNKLPRLKDVKNREHPDARTQFRVEIKLTIAPDGKVSKVEVLSSNSKNDDFDKALCDFISTWIFKKADRETTVTIPLKFDKM